MTSPCASLSREQSLSLYRRVLEDKDTGALRSLCVGDLFFLLYIGMSRRDVNKDWLYARCREVEAEPDGYLDLWAREHYKSTIITFAKTIQDLLSDPEITVGIFSHTRGIAKAFLKQIMVELESNDFLKGLFSDILWESPRRQAPAWSLDAGIFVNRASNPKEATVEAWGLVDSQPTGKHFSLMVYDDVVSRESVATPDQIAKTTNAWALSLNLSAAGGRVRYIGTRYHHNDTYREMIDRAAATPRLHAATVDGEANGAPVLLDGRTLRRKAREMGPYVFGAQMLLNPTADRDAGFLDSWLAYYDTLPRIDAMNVYVLVDPAGSKGANSDYSVFIVVGLHNDRHYYIIDAVRDRLNLAERTDVLFSLCRKYPVLKVGYEKYGIQADIEHIREKQDVERFRFPITSVGGNSLSKNERIRRLIPKFSEHRILLPHKMLFTDVRGKCRDFVREFVNDEYKTFPVSRHDDMLDCLARVLDRELRASFPASSLGSEDLGDSRMLMLEPTFTNYEYDILAV